MNKKNTKGTHVNIELDKYCNDILTESAKINKRTKRAEAAIRLNHHLETYKEAWLTPQEEKKKQTKE